MSLVWQCRDHRFEIGLPLILGIVNVTPDSFSDGDRFRDSHAAIDHALKLIDDGADILDIGGESTRPGATPVPFEEELARVIPVIREVARYAPVSVDTMKSDVARHAIDAGACIVNDVSGFRDPAMIDASKGVGMIINHMQGTPATMQASPTYSNVVEEVDSYFAERVKTLLRAGIQRENICIDPGIGFGKTLEHTLTQLRELRVYQRHGLPVCLGVSRKGFLGQITGRNRTERLAATLAINCFAIAQQAVQLVRVHDVKEHRDAIRLWEALSQTNIA